MNKILSGDKKTHPKFKINTERLQRVKDKKTILRNISQTTNFLGTT